MSQDSVELFFENLRQDIVAAMEEIGEETVEATQDSVGIECPQYHTGKGGHSPAGSPPYLEKGELQLYITSDVAEEGWNTVLRVTSIRPKDSDGVDVPQLLEFGSFGEDDTAHPYMRPQFDALAENFLPRLAAKIIK